MKKYVNKYIKIETFQVLDRGLLRPVVLALRMRYSIRRRVRLRIRRSETVQRSGKTWEVRIFLITTNSRGFRSESGCR